MTYSVTKQRASTQAQVRPREDLPTPGPGALWCLDAQVRAAPGSGQGSGDPGSDRPWESAEERRAHQALSEGLPCERGKEGPSTGCRVGLKLFMMKKLAGHVNFPWFDFQSYSAR